MSRATRERTNRVEYGPMDRVTAANPCPVCGKPDYCLIAPDKSAVICPRVPSAKRCGEAGWLHVLNDTPTVESRPVNTMIKPHTTNGKKKPKLVVPRDWQADAERFAKQLTTEDRAWIAKRIGLPVSAIDTIPLLGKLPNSANLYGIITTWPEMNAAGEVTCITDRTPGELEDEKKRQWGSTWGLTLPHGWRDRPGPLFVVEGPTDAAAMSITGLCCVARPSNSGGADLLAELLADWPADRAIVIVGEWDQKESGLWPGKTGMDHVANELAKLLGRSILTALPPQGTKDVLAWLTDPARGEAPWGERGRELSGYLLTNAVTIVGSPPSEKNSSPSPFGGDGDAAPSVVLPYRPFPLEALPPAMREFVRDIAQSVGVGCDPCFAALPALALTGAAIGGALVVSPKRGWNEVPTLWAVVIGDSGTAKSPAADPATAIAHAIEDCLEADHERAVAKFIADMESYKAKIKDDPTSVDPADKPVPPLREYFIADDVTIERLVENLKNSPRGIFVVQDELANWFGSFSRYKGKGDASDTPKWLGMFDGRSVSYQRKTSAPGVPRDIRVKRAIVSVSGGIQPGILAAALSDPSYVNSGLAARLVFAMPPKQCVRWSDTEPNEAVGTRFRAVIHALRKLAFDPKSSVSRIGLDVMAKAAFVPFHDAMASSAENHDGGEMAAAIPKLVRVSLRLAMIHHCATEADAGRDPGKSCIPEASMRAGIELAKWFECEAERVYAMLVEKPEDRSARILADYVRRKGGSITARQLQKSNARRYPNAEAAELALDGLASAGLGVWHEEVATNRKTIRRLVLANETPSDARRCPTLATDDEDDCSATPSDTVSDAVKSAACEALQKLVFPDTASDNVGRLTGNHRGNSDHHESDINHPLKNAVSDTVSDKPRPRNRRRLRSDDRPEILRDGGSA